LAQKAKPTIAPIAPFKYQKCGWSVRFICKHKESPFFFNLAHICMNHRLAVSETFTGSAKMERISKGKKH
jgi:hypothetical protein